MKKLIVALAILGTVPLSSPLLAGEGHRHNSSSQNQKEIINAEHGNSSGDAHDHGTLTIAKGQPVPDVDLVVSKDPINGWNLQMKLDNFILTPENVNEANRPNEGHAHLFVNGEKMGRIYSNWYHIPSLPSGENEIKVSLNSNSHQFLMYQGEMIEDIAIVRVP